MDIDLILVHKVFEVSEKKKPRGMKLNDLMTSRQNTYDTAVITIAIQSVSFSKLLSYFLLFYSLKKLFKSLHHI